MEALPYIYALKSEEVVEKGGRSQGNGREVVEGSRAKGGYCPVQTCGTTRRGRGVAGKGSRCLPLPTQFSDP